MSYSKDVQALMGLWQATCQRAAKIWPRLSALSHVRFWLPREELLRLGGEHAFFDDSLDLCEQFETPNQYAQEVLSPVFDEHFEQAQLGGAPAWVVRPFFQPHAGLLRKVGFGGLSPRRLEDFEVLKQAAQSVNNLGLQPHELCSNYVHAEITRVLTSGPNESPEVEPGRVLCGFYHGQALKVVNALRELRVALCYVERGLHARGTAQAGLSLSLKHENWRPLLAELTRMSTLSFEPALPQHFSSHSQLRLPHLACPAGLSSLLDASTVHA